MMLYGFSLESGPRRVLNKQFCLDAQNNFQIWMLKDRSVNPCLDFIVYFVAFIDNANVRHFLHECKHSNHVEPLIMHANPEIKLF